MKRCVIIGAAPTSGAASLKRYLTADDFVIAADGGVRLAETVGVHPQLIVADYDSSAPVDGVDVVRLPIEKDVTDTHAAMELAFQRGLRDFLLLGCLGGRLDHTVANLLSARHMTEKGCQVMLADAKHEMTVLLPGSYILPQTTRHLSLFAMSNHVKGLTLTGVKYPLNGYTLAATDPLCVSNAVVSPQATLCFSAGVLLKIFSED